MVICSTKGPPCSNMMVSGMADITKPKHHRLGNVYLTRNGRLIHSPEALRRACDDLAATTISLTVDQSMQSTPTLGQII